MPRMALADKLRAHEDFELADAVQAPTGKPLVLYTASLAVRTSLPVTHRLLWSAYAVIPRLGATPVVNYPAWPETPPAEPSPGAGDPDAWRWPRRPLTPLPAVPLSRPIWIRDRTTDAPDTSYYGGPDTNDR